ncbi:MAG: gas vesicle protein GvpG [Candidatus Melainabacteria bacterium]|nr:gas vesicle protein GvpG [Candidatus Melainabacteria bacterium]
MGLLFNLLTFPVSGPMKGMVAIARHIKRQADEELSEDTKSPETALLELEMLYELGEISEAELKIREQELLDEIDRKLDMQERGSKLGDSL